MEGVSRLHGAPYAAQAPCASGAGTLCSRLLSVGTLRSRLLSVLALCAAGPSMFPAWYQDNKFAEVRVDCTAPVQTALLGCGYWSLQVVPEGVVAVWDHWSQHEDACIFGCSVGLLESAHRCLHLWLHCGMIGISAPLLTPVLAAPDQWNQHTSACICDCS